MQPSRIYRDRPARVAELVDAADSKSAVRKDVLVRFQSRAQAEALLRLFYFCNMVHVYVIESLTDKTWYTGIALNAANRLKAHNSGKNRFTKGHSPWKIIYAETHENWQEARNREKYLKSAAGKRWLEKELNGCAGSLPD